jgi:hypothetical protein
MQPRTRFPLLLGLVAGLALALGGVFLLEGARAAVLTGGLLGLGLAVGNPITARLQQADAAAGKAWVQKAQTALAPLVARAKAHVARLRPLLEAPDVRELFAEWSLVDTRAFLDRGCPIGMVESFKSVLGQAQGLAAEPGQLLQAVAKVESLSAEEATPDVHQQSIGREPVTVQQLREDLGRLTPVHLAEDLLWKLRVITGELETWATAHPAEARPEYPPQPPKGGDAEYAETKFNPRAR